MPRESTLMDDLPEISVFSKVWSIIKIALPIQVLKAVIMYIMWIAMHYAASHIYVKICTHASFYGFLMSPIIIDTPYCAAIRWMIYNGASQIKMMWAFFGGYVANGLEKIWA